MSKGAQLTVYQLLQSRQSTSVFDDRYAELKKIGFKKRSDSFIENEMPMKQKWYRFWNEEALSYVDKEFKNHSWKEQLHRVGH